MICILLTEDLADQRMLYCDVLTAAGFRVIEASNAARALELFQKHKPDLVVLDIQMPGMDGIQALGEFLSHNRNTPVILYSAYPAFKQNFMTWAADAFVEKTGHPKELVDAINTVLQSRGIPLPEPQAAIS